MATTTAALATMKVAAIAKPGADFEIVEREIPKPRPGEVRIKVQACGICHSDVLTKEGLWPGIQYPRVPGHEVAGIVERCENQLSRPIRVENGGRSHERSCRRLVITTSAHTARFGS